MINRVIKSSNICDILPDFCYNSNALLHGIFIFSNSCNLMRLSIWKLTTRNSCVLWKCCSTLLKNAFTIIGTKMSYMHAYMTYGHAHRICLTDFYLLHLFLVVSALWNGCCVVWCVLCILYLLYFFLYVVRF